MKDIETTSLQEFFEKEYEPDRMQTLMLRATVQVYDKTDHEWKKGILNIMLSR